MGEAHYEARARVTVVVELDSGRAWPAGTQIDQVIREASEAAISRIDYLIKEADMGGLRMVGSPRVVITLLSQVVD
jgi:hypothetical protein